MRLSSVVLPEPEGPMSARNSPAYCTTITLARSIQRSLAECFEGAGFDVETRLVRDFPTEVGGKGLDDARFTNGNGEGEPSTSAISREAGPPLPPASMLPLSLPAGLSDGHPQGLPVLYDWGRTVEGYLTLEVPPAKGPRGEVGSYLYQEGLVTGLGSNPVGLDRGQIGDTRIVTLRRVGGRVLVEQPNLRFRALTEDPAEPAPTEAGQAATEAPGRQ